MAAPPACRAIDRYRVLPESTGQVMAAASKELDPEIGDAVADPGHGAASPAPLQGFGSESCGLGDLAQERREVWRARAQAEAQALCTLGLGAKSLHERAASQDPLVRNIAFPSPAEGGYGLPAAQAPKQTPALEVGAAPLRDADGHEGPVAPASAGHRGGEPA